MAGSDVSYGKRLTDPPVKVKLYEHQRRGWLRAMDALVFGGGGFGLLYEMGCGKTVTAIAIMGSLFQEGLLRRALIIAPASVCGVWQRELEKYAAFPFECVHLTGTAAKRRSALKRLSESDASALRVAVINYEGAWRIPDRLRGEDAILDVAPGLVLCDESHRIKQGSARQSKYIHSLGDRAGFRMILTGTPIQNNPLDFFSQYRFLDKSVFGTSFLRFRARYAVMGGYAVNGRPVQVIGYRNLSELSEKAYSCADRVTKAECLDLPPQTFETRYVELTETGRSLYAQLRQQSVAWLGEHPATAQNVLSRLLLLQRLTGGFLRPDDADEAQLVDSAKLDALNDILVDLNDAGEKCVVFVRFLDELFAISEQLEKNGIGFVRIYGDVPQQERGALVDRFQSDPDTRVFLAQIDTAGLGITLTAARVAVFYSPTWNYASYQQALARTHRIGAQHSECHYIHLICPGTVDEDVMSALEDKKSLADYVVDGKIQSI